VKERKETSWSDERLTDEDARAVRLQALREEARNYGPAREDGDAVQDAIQWAERARCNEPRRSRHEFNPFDYPK